jgi:hypothetical protein
MRALTAAKARSPIDGALAAAAVGIGAAPAFGNAHRAAAPDEQAA